jgi:hypothetical protein
LAASTEEEGGGEEKEATVVPPTPLLKTLEDILHNRIKQKKQEMHKTHNIVDTKRVWTEIEIFQWVLAGIFTLLRRSRSAS